MEITPSEIKDAYSAVMGRHILDGIFGFFGAGAFQLTNLNYNPLNFDEVAEILELDPTDEFPYVYNEFEKYTCADYTYSLMGAMHKNMETAAMPIFSTWVMLPGGGHAVMSFYNHEDQFDDDGDLIMFKGVYIIEPQNDEIMDMEEAKEFYGGTIALKLLNG